MHVYDVAGLSMWKVIFLESNKNPCLAHVGVNVSSLGTYTHIKSRIEVTPEVELFHYI